ncbi:MAG: SDR family oxidoreductase [Lentisphaeria bacterium]|nr:SDR family oxidoreductase [Lentisphaeria bacterium]
MDFMQLKDKTIAVMGVANKRSVATAVAKALREIGARIVFIVRDEETRDRNGRIFGDDPVLVCDVENEAQVAALPGSVAACCEGLDGFVHSIAFANYSEGFNAFHSTVKADFLQAMDISCFSLVNVVNALKEQFTPNASIVTMSISTTRMASENYGYMGPVKAALNSSVVFLAKSLSVEVSPEIRVNAVGAGLLKTSASAGIPGYVDSYLYAEAVTLRGRALEVDEAANTVVFLLSPRSSGVNAQTLVVDAGMSVNYFDRHIVRRVVGGEGA